jgi:hypothetical protein
MNRNLYHGLQKIGGKIHQYGVVWTVAKVTLHGTAICKIYISERHVLYISCVVTTC